MRRLPDDLALLACARAAKLCGRADVVSVEFEEIDLSVSVRPATREEWAAFVPLNMSQATRGAARFNFVASCLVYPCDARGEPDLEALTVAADELPAMITELASVIEEMTSGTPMDSIVVTDETAPVARKLIGDAPLAALRAAHKRLRVIGMPEGAPVKAFGLRAPPRVSWEAAADAASDSLVDAAELLALDCIVGLSDEARASLVKYYPGLALALYPVLEYMAGSRRRAGEPRKKVRRGYSGS